ncbi:hypothetical protein ACQPWW_13575 [Micromonospora sp. CA-240977]|uniref:hypothetical protein n=1 Tax=Micromonospora sp. CA-240977 TaxID=3239957 RepID=UPI003D93A50D
MSARQASKTSLRRYRRSEVERTAAAMARARHRAGLDALADELADHRPATRSLTA